MHDQASKLRKMVSNKKTSDRAESIKIFSIVSGKGGVGKTNFAVNFAVKLAQKGKRVLILDADIGFNNANILLGIDTRFSLYHLLNEDIPLEDIVVKGPEGVDILSGGSELLLMENLDNSKQEQIMEELRRLNHYDTLIIDNCAGVNMQTLSFTIFAHDIILITTPEPTAITDAYSFLKIIATYKLKNKVKVVINQIQDSSTGITAFNNLASTSKRFLNLELENLGFIFNDIRVNKSVMNQEPIVLKYPNSLASKNIDGICENLLNDNTYYFNTSNLEQFCNRLLKVFG